MIYLFDVDGTLYDNHSKRISEGTRLALDRLIHLGHHLCICTSRSYEELMPLKEIFKYFEYIICCAGSMVYQHGKCVYQKELEGTKQLITWLENHHVIYRYVTTKGHGYLNQESGYATEIFMRLYQMVPPVFPYADQSCCHILFYLKSPLKEQLLDYAKSFGNEIISFDEAGEILPENVSKAKIIPWIISQYDGQQDVICFGDGRNDVDMLEMADVGIAMGNASDFVKQHAHYVTKTVQEDGIPWALKQLKMI